MLHKVRDFGTSSEIRHQSADPEPVHKSGTSPEKPQRTHPNSATSNKTIQTCPRHSDQTVRPNSPEISPEAGFPTSAPVYRLRPVRSFGFPD